MKLLEKFQAEKIALMKANRVNKNDENTVKINTINDVLTEAKKECVNKKILNIQDLNENDFLNVVTKVAKQLTQEIDGLNKANRPTYLVEVQQDFLATFLPKKKTEKETTEIIQDLITQGKNFSEIMGIVSKQKNEFDMRMVSKITKELLK
jgi:Yqey-like protein.